MNTSITLIIGWWLFGLIIEALTWGTTGYVVFRLLKGKADKWVAGALATFLVFLAWDGFLTSSILSRLDISIGNKSLLEFLGGDVSRLLRVDASDVIVSFFQTVLGFKVAQMLMKKHF